MTVGEMPLAPATPDAGVDRARVIARSRARLEATLGDVKALHTAGRVWSVVVADARSWWLVAAEPPSLSAWLAAQSPAERRVPAGSGLLRGLWIVHNWTFGALVAAVSIVLFLAAAGLRWLAGHPARFWMAVAMASALIAWVALA